MSLYLKYRPQDFKSVVGQEHVVRTLKNALQRSALVHAYLFAGPRGTGKTSLARILAKAINCLALKEGEPCSECALCLNIHQGRLVDLIEIDAASNRGIDEIRELREKILFAPTHARAKVYIIDEVHMLTKEAFNALLKTLEEPPDHAYFILATTEVHKIPETILSRCQQFIFRRIDAEGIKRQLNYVAGSESITAEPEALSLIAKMASGSLRDAIGMLEQMTMDGHLRHDYVATSLGLSGTLLTESFFQALTGKKVLKALEIINQINAQGKNLHQFTTEFIGFLREQLLINIENPETLTLLLKLLEIFSEAKNQINQALIPQLPLEMAVAKVSLLMGMEPPVMATASALPSKEKQETTSDLNLDEIKRQWPQVIAAIETPFIRVSLMDGEPVKFEKGELHLVFKSGSLMEKVVSGPNQAQIQQAFLTVFKTKFKLKIELKKINLKPVLVKSAAEKPNLVEMAKEVFGS